MSEMWEQHRPFVIAIATWLGGSLLFLLAVRLPLYPPVAKLRHDDDTKLAQHYAAPGRTVPNATDFDKAQDAAEAERARLDAELKDVLGSIEFQPRPELVVEPGATQRAYEYAKLRDRLTSELRELANKAGIGIPNELDPRRSAKDLPGESETDELLFRLAMTDRVVRDAIAARVSRVASLEHQLGAPLGSPLAARVVKVKLEGNLDTLIGFIEKCSTPAGAGGKADGAGILVVRSLELTSAGGGSALAAQVELAAVKAAAIEEEEARQQLAPERGDGTGTGRAHRSY